MKVNFENFTGLYPLSKTLRFELRPVGTTYLQLFTFRRHYLRSVAFRVLQTIS